MSAPLISVVIPCRNEVKAIQKCVDAIYANDYPAIEVLVVDGISEDGTRELVRDLQSKYPTLRLVDNPHQLTPYAFNLGVTNAKGEYIQIVGSRNIMASDYLRRLKAVLDTRADIACVGGDYQHVYEDSKARYIALAMESKFGMGSSNYRTMRQDGPVDTVGVPMYRKGIFSEVGLFDNELTRNQDDEFNFRVRLSGYKIWYVHEAKVTYLVRASLQKAYHQFFQYGYFKVRVSQKHAQPTTLRQLVPAAFLAFLVLNLLFTIVSLWAMLSLIAVIFIYSILGLALAGKGLSFLERLRVLRVCLVLHLAYGSGFWRGIWDFLICRRKPQDRFQQQTV